MHSAEHRQPLHFQGGVADAIVTVFGTKSAITEEQRIGSCVQRCVLNSGETVCIKSIALRDAPQLQAEYSGLATLGEQSDFHIPHIFLLGQDAETAYMISEYIKSGASTKSYYQSFGALLATMHHHASVDRFGGNADNWIGAKPQINTWDDDWLHFFAVHRLQYQFDCAIKNGYITERQKAQFARAITNAYRLLRPLKRGSLVHGDLWSGNWFADSDGQPVLIDPAIYYGDPEVDIAMTELFGGMSREFYIAYYAHNPLQDGYQTRKIFYDLYHMLNHLNIFGSGYHATVLHLLQQAAQW